MIMISKALIRFEERPDISEEKVEQIAQRILQRLSALDKKTGGHKAAR